MTTTNNIRQKYGKSIHFNCKDGDEAFTDGYVLWLEQQLLTSNDVEQKTQHSDCDETSTKKVPPRPSKDPHMLKEGGTIKLETISYVLAFMVVCMGLLVLVATLITSL